MAAATNSPSPGDSHFELKHAGLPAVTAIDDGLTNSAQSSIVEDKTFVRTEGVEDYEPIDAYEGKHRWDPIFEWTSVEEKRIVRKIDLRICSWVCLTFFALQLDRANIVQALTDNMLTDLGMNTNNYNYGQTMSVSDAFACIF